MIFLPFVHLSGLASSAVLQPAALPDGLVPFRITLATNGRLKSLIWPALYSVLQPLWINKDLWLRKVLVGKGGRE